MICQRCAREVGAGVHTCNPSKLIREKDAEIERLRAVIQDIQRSLIADGRTADNCFALRSIAALAGKGE